MVETEAPVRLGLVDQPPAWVVAELPPRYAELMAQIDALHQEAGRVAAMAAMLWQTGDALVAAVSQTFAALGFTTTAAAPDANYDIAVQVDPGRRLLLEILGTPDAVDRKSPKITQMLRAIQLDATDQDRVVLVANAHCATPIQQRTQEPIALDALKLIVGLGGNVVPASTLFATWKYSFTDKADARKIAQNLHALEGGLYR